MAQRKSAPPSRSGSSKSGPGSGRSGATKPSGSKAGAKPAGTAKTTSVAGAPAAAKSAGQGPRKPPSKKKSIVNQKQTPWGLIIATGAVVVFAAAIVGVVIATHKSSSGDATTSIGGQNVNASDPYRQPALAAAMAITGVTYRVEGLHNHVTSTVKYDASPPIGGDHAPIWADCTGKVYTHQLASENAVHALEHGAVWVTYNPAKVTKAQIAVLAKDVGGVDRALLTPYAGLKTAVSLQAWGYQLFVNSASDPRVDKFITTLSGNTKTWPEQAASCSDPYFNANDSHPGHPQEQ